MAAIIHSPVKWAFLPREPDEFLSSKQRLTVAVLELDLSVHNKFWTANNFRCRLSIIMFLHGNAASSSSKRGCSFSSSNMRNKCSFYCDLFNCKNCRMPRGPIKTYQTFLRMLSSRSWIWQKLNWTDLDPNLLQSVVGTNFYYLVLNDCVQISLRLTGLISH